ncbi:hypothetical protein M8494_36120 [Serratia ureilytica]
MPFAEVGLEPVSSIWAISALQDDIEHLQVITFRLAFELAEVAGCEAEIKADKADLQAAGYALTAERPSRFTALLLTLAGNNRTVPHPVRSMRPLSVRKMRLTGLCLTIFMP